MPDQLADQLARLYAEGQAYDAAEPDRRRRRRNLEPPSAALPAQLVRVAAARAIVEIGTSNGYSTLWLAAAAADTAGRVTTVDVEPAESARRNLDEAGLGELVEFVVADGGGFLASTAADTVDVLFLDAERSAYLDWWPDIQRVLRPGGLLVIDNVLAPDPSELTDLLATITLAEHWRGETVPVGKGLFLGWRGRSVGPAVGVR